VQKIVIDQPYAFIPPRLSRFWLWMVRPILARQLRKDFGIAAVECLGADKLRASLAAGHGVILVGNHSRPCDPLVLDTLAREVGRPVCIIASWHLFMTSKVKHFLLPRLGCFSVYREGLDRESLKCAVNTVAEGKHPLVIFAEGIVTRSNDCLLNFMEGPAFIGRAAAKQRQQGKVVIHPVFIRYFFEGDLRAAVIPVLEAIESRLTWQPQNHLPLRERIHQVGAALLGLKEIEYLTASQPGSLRERLHRLMDHLLKPLEDQWCAGRHDGDAMIRVKRLRTAILPALANGELSAAQRAVRWHHLADVYLVQQLHCYPSNYIENPTPEHILETVERYEEDLTDVARAHYPIRAVITVGAAIVVDATRDRTLETDPITAEVRRQMELMVESSKACRKIFPTGMDRL